MQTNSPPPPDQILMQILMGKLLSRILTVAANAGVADHLTDGPKSVAELAEKTGSNEDALYRVLRALSAASVFTESGDRIFENNEVSKLLVRNVQGSLLDMVRWINCKPAWDAWGHLDYSLETGKPAFDEVFGKQVFEYFKDNQHIELMNKMLKAYAEVKDN